MSFLKFIIISVFGTLMFWAAWLAILFFQSPVKTASLLMFYGCLFFALHGTFSLIGILGRYYKQRDAVVYKFVDLASKEALLLSALFVLALFLQSRRWLIWWNLVMLMLSFGLLELLFVSYKKNN